MPIANPHAPVIVYQEAAALERAVEEDRVRRGLPPLVIDERLRAVALDWAREMADRRFFGHFDPEGRGLIDRLRAIRYAYHYAAENIALDTGASSANIGLMRSPGHAANILSRFARRIGVAAVNIGPNETLFVEDFSD